MLTFINLYAYCYWYCKSVKFEYKTILAPEKRHEKYDKKLLTINENKIPLRLRFQKYTHTNIKFE